MNSEAKMSQSRGWLRNGNPPGDFTKAPRCEAKTRRGTACQCPALMGRHRCRLHGGRSTGPRTHEGLERIRAANTLHGRYSAEYLALLRWLVKYRANGIRSARRFPVKEFRERLIARAMQPIATQIVEEMRVEIRQELAREERQRLCGKSGRYLVDRDGTIVNRAIQCASSSKIGGSSKS